LKKVNTIGQLKIGAAFILIERNFKRDVFLIGKAQSLSRSGGPKSPKSSCSVVYLVDGVTYSESGKFAKVLEIII